MIPFPPFSKTGIVPQFDCLLDHCTGREHLRVYARLSGLYYPAKDDRDRRGDEEPLLAGGEQAKPLTGEARVDAYLALVGLSSRDGDRPAGDYSGGMKRKLSVACTLITDPELLFLDEMCAGVDIVAQRTLWRLLVTRPPGQTIISTTHSMLEADWDGNGPIRIFPTCFKIDQLQTSHRPVTDQLQISYRSVTPDQLQIRYVVHACLQAMYRTAM